MPSSTYPIHTYPLTHNTPITHTARLHTHVTRDPDEEYKYLKTRHTLDQHLCQRIPAGTSTSASSSLTSTGSSRKSRNNRTPSPYSTSSSRDDRVHRSEMRYATRKALDRGVGVGGSSWDWVDDDEADAMNCKSEIPQRYLDEFNRRWYEDDIKHNRVAYASDTNRTAPWRQPGSVYFDDGPRGVEGMMQYVGEYRQSIDPGNNVDVRPQLLRSKFSFDADSEDEGSEDSGRSSGKWRVEMWVKMWVKKSVGKTIKRVDSCMTDASGGRY
ncbi:hypothetical protein M011DRAFT_514777 [Sporormia fimetaria CBS 119925]|uniref:Uncharacterized protein n=1 Tax=Sporormia fimetaria CBS 119925 TaxID=1340428 RepID=A0A6A6VJE0_9PLEO|nr:hypothetical protein M011DRAFT_514777 [Sporormia fimetaria CBS 119925]